MTTMSFQQFLKLNISAPTFVLVELHNVTKIKKAQRKVRCAFFYDPIPKKSSTLVALSLHKA